MPLPKLLASSPLTSVKVTLFENEVVSTRMVAIRITNDGEAMGKEKTIFSVVGRVNLCSHYGNQ